MAPVLFANEEIYLVRLLSNFFSVYYHIFARKQKDSL